MQILKTANLTPEERQAYQARYDDLILCMNVLDELTDEETLTDEEVIEMQRLGYILNPSEQYWRGFAPDMDVLEAIQ